MSLASFLPVLDRELLLLNKTPLLGTAPPCPFKELASRLVELFLLDSLEITSGTPRLQQAEEPSLVHPITLGVALSSLEGSGHFTMEEGDVDALLSLMVGGGRYLAALADRDLKRGLIEFLALEVMGQLRALGYPPQLALQLTKATPLQGPSLTIPLTLSINDHSLSATLSIDAALTRSWRQYCATQTINEAKVRLRREMELSLPLVVGSTTLTREEFSAARHGDLLLLDHCSLDPDTKQGELVLFAGGRPLLKGHAAEGGWQVTEVVEVYAEGVTMDETEEYEDEEALPEEEAEAEYDEEEAEEEETPPPAPSATISLDRVPVTMTVEVARLKMTAEKLISLTPGEVLELDTSLEGGVTLVVEGKAVGRGELIRIGELLGVRITEL